MELAGLRLVDDGEEIAPNAVAHGLDDAEDGVRSNGGIHGASAQLEDLRPCS
jgi:hypothetical protein